MTILVSVLPLPIFKEHKQVVTDTRYLNALEIMSKANRLLDWLQNFKVYVAPSKIHGVGIFAIDDINKGDLIFEYSNKNTNKLSRQTLNKIDISKNQQDVLSRMYYADEKAIYIKHDQDIHWVNFMNHSKKPNMIYGLNKYFAKRNIKANEELTLDFTAKQYHPTLNFKTNE